MKFLTIAVTLLIAISVYPQADNKAEKFDEFGKVTTGELEARIDVFYQTLSGRNDADGVVVVYPGAGHGPQFSFSGMKNRVSKYLAAREADLNRFTFVEGGALPQPKTELWLVPHGAAYPLIAPRSPRSPPANAQSFIADREFIDDITSDTPEWQDQIYDRIRASMLTYPNTYAVILSRPGKGSTPRASKALQLRVKNQLFRKGIDPARLLFAEGSKREEALLHVWLVRKGVKFPPDKPQLPASAVLFDTFEVRPDNVLTWKEEYEAKRARYAAALYDADLKPYLITYEPRILRPDVYSMEKGETRLPRHFDFKIEANFWKWGLGRGWANGIDGGNREYSAVEFWVVPPGAEPPKPTPTVKAEEAIICPMVSVRADWLQLAGKGLLEFKALHQAKGPAVQFGFEWTVENGRIESGQGTDEIKVRANEGFLGNVKAQVQMTGFDRFCELKDSRGETATEVWKDRIKVDEIGKASNGDIKARSDYFAINLQNGPSLVAAFINYGPARFVAARKHLIKAYLTKNRGIDPARLLFIEGGDEKDIRTQVWLVEQGAKLPSPIPPPGGSKLARCPKIAIAGPVFGSGKKETLEYRAVYDVALFPQPPLLKWYASDGEIILIEMLGSDVLKPVSKNDHKVMRLWVDRPDRGEFTVALEMETTIPGCEKLVTSVQTSPSRDSIRVNWNSLNRIADLMGEMENFVAYLKQDPIITGYVISYGPLAEVERREKLIRERISKNREIDPARVVFIDGGRREEEASTKLWVVPYGAPPPQP